MRFGLRDVAIVGFCVCAGGAYAMLGGTPPSIRPTSLPQEATAPEQTSTTPEEEKPTLGAVMFQRSEHHQDPSPDPAPEQTRSASAAATLQIGDKTILLDLDGHLTSFGRALLCTGPDRFFDISSGTLTPTSAQGQLFVQLHPESAALSDKQKRLVSSFAAKQRMLILDVADNVENLLFQVAEQDTLPKIAGILHSEGKRVWWEAKTGGMP